MIPQYLDLTKKGGAPARLCILRNKAAHSNAPDSTLPPSRRFADWRAARTSTLLTDCDSFGAGYNTENAGTKYEKRTPVWYTHDKAAHFRNERNVEDVEGACVRHSGWYSDADCEETIFGIVAYLNHGRFIAGYKMTCNDERVYFAKVFDCEIEAARYADNAARQLAEQEKEYSERWRAACDLNDDCETLESDIKELIPMRHHARARRELKEAIGDLRDKRETLAEDYADINF